MFEVLEDCSVMRRSTHIQFWTFLLWLSLGWNAAAQQASPENAAAPDQAASPASSKQSSPDSKIETPTGDSASTAPADSMADAIRANAELARKAGIPTRYDELYEDLTKPAVQPNMTTDVVHLDKETKDGITRELIHVQWRQFDPIDLWVMKPANVKKPPVILYLYSYPSTNDRYKDMNFCRFLTENGFAAVGFVSALTGQRYHDIATREWFVRDLQAALGASVHDVQLILNYLDKRGDMDMTRVGMWGDGSGATIALIAASVDSRIKALDLVDPWGDWPTWLAKSSLVPENQRADLQKPEFLKSVENFEPVSLFPRLTTPQVRIQHINDVTVTPQAVRERMEAAAPPQATVVHYPNTQAFVSDVAKSGKSFDWIKEQLEPVASARSKGAETKVSQ
jgi:hypothetical protein